MLQTVGSVNVGGAGNHKRVHTLQARIFGRVFLPAICISSVVTTLLQGVWSLTIGLVLRLAEVRGTARWRPPERSTETGSRGWVSFSTPMELWAYATEA